MQFPTPIYGTFVLVPVLWDLQGGLPCPFVAFKRAHASLCLFPPRPLPPPFPAFCTLSVTIIVFPPIKSSTISILPPLPLHLQPPLTLPTSSSNLLDHPTPTAPLP